MSKTSHLPLPPRLNIYEIKNHGPLFRPTREYPAAHFGAPPANLRRDVDCAADGDGNRGVIRSGDGIRVGHLCILGLLTCVCGERRGRC